MSKSTKSEVLKHWFGIDSILLGGAPKEKLQEDSFDKYLSTKGALLSNLYEIYQKVDFEPDFSCNTVKEMSDSDEELAKTSKERAKSILETASVGKLVRSEIKEMGDVEGLSGEHVARYVVLKRRNAIALDSMLLEDALKDGRKKSLSDWKGKVLVDAHKTLRDDLINISLK